MDPARHLFSALLVCVLLFAPLVAFAIGEVKVESSGFLRSADDRADSTNTLQLGPRFRTDAEYFESRTDLFGIVQISDRSSLTFEAPELYAGLFVGFDANGDRTGTKGKATSLAQASLGRKLERWSILDDYWELGLISPRFTWDPTRPRKVGLTGLHVEWSSPHFRVVALASPINIPERGFPIKSEGGKLVTSDPFAQQQYESAVLAAREIPIRYNINLPPTSDLILKPTFVLSARVQESPDAGLFAQPLAARLPIHQPSLAVLPTYLIADRVVDVQVYPEILSHTILGGEVGYRAPNFTVWASYFHEKPDEWVTPELWVTPRIEDAEILSAGFDYFFSRSLRLRNSILHIDEADKPKSVNNDFTVDLRGRFQFHRATRTGLEFYGTSRLRYELDWRHDLELESDLVSANVYFQFLRPSGVFTVSLGADVFSTATTSGTIGGWKGNDRVRGGLAYAF